jgi:glutamine amidotransferase
VTVPVVIVDYGMGNLFSVASALRYLGAEPSISSDPEVVARSPHTILPGVGSFRLAMERLRAGALDDALRSALGAGGTLLGICLGMQLLGASSTEDGTTKGLGLVPNGVARFDDATGLKVPHVGFNEVAVTDRTGLFAGLPDVPHFYFVHSYRMEEGALSCPRATCNYGGRFLAAFDAGQVGGTQFHPEKSQSDGLTVLRNFIRA